MPFNYTKKDQSRCLRGGLEFNSWNFYVVLWGVAGIVSMRVYGLHLLLPVHILIGIFQYAYGQAPGSSLPWSPSASSPSQSALPPLVFSLENLPRRFPFQMCTSFAAHKAKSGSKIPLPNLVSIPQVLHFLGSLNPNNGAVEKTDRCITKKNLWPSLWQNIIYLHTIIFLALHRFTMVIVRKAKEVLQHDDQKFWGNLQKFTKCCLVSKRLSIIPVHRCNVSDTKH